MLIQLWYFSSLFLSHYFSRASALQVATDHQPNILETQFDEHALIQTKAFVTPMHKGNASRPRFFERPEDWLRTHNLARYVEALFGRGMAQPLSMATWCTMLLTTLSLLVFIAWSFASNIDELTGRGKPSQVTDILVTASRSLSYPPVFCSIFIACQMHKLVLNGHGVDGTTISSSVCMVIASLGIVLEFLCVFLVPFCAEIPKGQMLSKIAFMSHCDVHAVFSNLAAVHSTTPSFLVKSARVAMILMYGGVIGVICAMVAKGVKLHREGFLAVSLTCVVIIGFSYLTVHVCLWLTTASEAVKDTRPWKVGPHEDRIKLIPKRSVCQAAALSAAMTMRRAPMIAILFLSDRLHTLDILGWAGSSTPFANSVFAFTTVAFLLEVVFSAFVGALGKEATGYNEVHIYTSCWKLQFAQFICNCLTHAGLLLNLYLLVFMTHQADDVLPTSIIVIIGLSTMFFVCHFSQAVAFFLKDICGINFKLLQDTTIAACTSVTVCPMVSILLIAARLHAVQITNRNGSSQLWAQTAMYLIGFAIVVQAACCLFLPLFAGLSKHDEKDADEDETLEPLLGIGAYIVIGVKYFALICIVAGVVAVCISIYLITPETATYGSYVGHFELLQYIVVAVLALLLALCLLSAKVVGLAVKVAVERAAHTNLGIDIRVAKAALSMCDGWVYIKDVVVHNLQKGGTEFKSPYLIKCSKVVLQLDIWQLVKTRGKKVVIYKVEVSGVDILVEKHSFSEMSSLQVLAKYLDHTQASGEGCPAPLGFLDAVCKPCADKLRLQWAKTHKRLQKIKKLKDVSFVTMHDVSVDGLQAAIWHHGQAMLDVPLEDVAINHQGKEVAPFEIIERLLIEVLHKVSQNREFRKRLLQLMGQRVTNNIVGCFRCKEERLSETVGCLPSKEETNELAGNAELEDENRISSSPSTEPDKRKKRRPDGPGAGA